MSYRPLNVLLSLIFCWLSGLHGQHMVEGLISGVFEAHTFCFAECNRLVNHVKMFLSLH